MKTSLRTLPLMAAVLLFIISCQKNNDLKIPSGSRHIYYHAPNYSSLKDFFAKNGVPMQTFNVNAATGGSFTSDKGTKILIPANEFMTKSGGPVTGTVKIEFRDIYKKSDMLLSNMPTDFGGKPLLSAGEFFIRATSGGNTVVINTKGGAQPIKIIQPALNPQDTMNAFNNKQDSLGGGFNGGGTWYTSATDSVYQQASNYVFSLYSFGSSPDSGTWCNSDNSGYYGGFPQTSLTLHCTDTVSKFEINVFLVFKNHNTMVHVYQDYTIAENFPYNYAPVGLECTVVVVAVRDANIYSSFTPITISANQTVDFSLKQTTTDDFKAQLTALNN